MVTTRGGSSGNKVPNGREEVVSLMKNGGANSSSDDEEYGEVTTTIAALNNKKGSSAGSSNRRWMLPICGIAVVAVLFFVAVLKNVTDEEDDLSGIGEVLNKAKDGINGLISSAASSAGATPFDMKPLIDEYRKAKTKMIRQLKLDYGDDTFGDIFHVDKNNIDVSRKVFKSPSAKLDQNDLGISWERMKRKLMIKIIQAIILNSNDEVEDDADADADAVNNKKETVQFIWATGGHSAAAGHGNMYDESYTAIMEKNAKGVFNAVGIELIGRNYAMGGTSSGVELGVCVEEIFGKDIDVLSWDFGMTDGSESELLDLYFRRAAIIRQGSSPVCVAYHQDGSGGAEREKRMLDLEQIGIATFYSDMSYIRDEVMDRIPDTLGKSDDEIATMAPYLRNFKCGGKIENGDPGCKELKFNNTMCNDRRFRTSWHPGWRRHALDGNLIAVFIIEVLYEALIEIDITITPSKDQDEDVGEGGQGEDSTTPMTLDGLLAELQRLERVDYQSFIKAAVPDANKNNLFMKEALPPNDVDMDIIFKSPKYCHTARLPAEIRHKGILTQTNKMIGFYDYDKGLLKRDADSADNDSDSMRLVYDGDSRQVCEVTLNMDHKDYQYVNNKDGWKELTLPNNLEVREYGKGRGKDFKLKGLIMVCFTTCDWGKCPNGNLLSEDIIGNDKKGEIEINGVPVTDISFGMNLCELLRHDNGPYFTPNDDGRFVIRAKANQPGSYLRFSSFIIW